MNPLLTLRIALRALLRVQIELGHRQENPAELLSSPNPFADGAAATYVHAELIDDAHMNNIGDAGNMLERYLFILQERHSAFGQVFNAMAKADGGVLFHCFAGKDRTGIVAAPDPA